MLARLNTAHKAPNVGLAIEGHVHPLGLGETPRHAQRRLDQALLLWQDYRYALLNLLD